LGGKYWFLGRRTALPSPLLLLLLEVEVEVDEGVVEKEEGEEEEEDRARSRARRRLARRCRRLRRRGFLTGEAEEGVVVVVVDKE